MNFGRDESIIVSEYTFDQSYLRMNIQLVLDISSTMCNRRKEGRKEVLLVVVELWNTVQ